MKNLFILSAVLFTLFGCSSSSILSDSSQEIINYSTTECHGTCPIYSLSLSPDGKVIFNGLKYTNIQGIKEVKVTQETYNKIADQLNEYRPKTGESISDNNCSKRATDHQFVNFVWLAKSGTETKFEHYKGCMDESGRKLNSIIEQLPMELGVAELIK